MSDCCGNPEESNLKDRARARVGASRAARAAGLDAEEAARRCSDTPHTFAGYSKGQPLLQPLGGEVYPARGRMITNASVVRGAPVAALGCGIRLNQMTRRRTSEEEVPVAQVSGLAYMVVFQDSGGVSNVSNVDIQRVYVGGIGVLNLPPTLVFEIDRTVSTSTPGYFRAIAFQAAMALEPRGAVVEIRKGRLYPALLDTGEAAPSNLAEQQANPTSDYYRFPSKQAFLVGLDGSVTEIAPGSNQHIGTWEYSRFEPPFSEGAVSSYCLEAELQPGGNFVSNDVNRYLGKTTVIRPTQPAAGENLLIGGGLAVSNLSSGIAQQSLIFGTDTERQFWLCNAQLGGSLTQCSATAINSVPIVLPRIIPAPTGVVQSAYQLQLSGLLT